MTLPDVLRSVYLINLDDSVDRLRLCIERNKHIQMIRFSASDGKSLDREALIRGGYISQNLPYENGTLGCAMSHIRLWELAASENRPITICEDDMVTSEYFYERASEVIASLPDDWDFIQWGYWLGNNNLYLWVDYGITKAHIDGYGEPAWRSPEEYNVFQSQNFLVAPVKLLHSYGTFGYSISAEGARQALTHCLPLQDRLVRFEDGYNREDNGIDVILCSLFPKIKAYICMPQLIIPSFDGSSVRLSNN